VDDSIKDLSLIISDNTRENAGYVRTVRMSRTFTNTLERLSKIISQVLARWLFNEKLGGQSCIMAVQEQTAAHLILFYCSGRGEQPPKSRIAGVELYRTVYDSQLEDWGPKRQAA
jgi:hypothetical protein